MMQMKLNLSLKLRTQQLSKHAEKLFNKICMQKDTAIIGR